MHTEVIYPFNMGFLHSSVGKESACNARDLGLIPGLGRSPGEGNGNPLQYSCLENPMDRGAWQDTVHRVTGVEHNLATKERGTERVCQHTVYPVMFGQLL